MSYPLLTLLNLIKCLRMSHEAKQKKHETKQKEHETKEKEKAAEEGKGSGDEAQSPQSAGGAQPQIIVNVCRLCSLLFSYADLRRIQVPNAESAPKGVEAGKQALEGGNKEEGKKEEQSA